jgi:hypothetical protein
MGLWKQVGSKADARATWVSQDSDTLAGLAKKVKLSTDVREMNAWLAGGPFFFKGSFDLAATGHLIASDTSRALCSGQKFTVPNIWLAANLLQGGNLGDQFVNLGGLFGMIPTDLFVHKKVIRVQTFGSLAQALSANAGNIHSDIWSW